MHQLNRMADDSQAYVWQIVTPAEWPSPPQRMSLSLLAELESCPRKWALEAANYPEIWKRQGYPKAMNIASLKGVIVHGCLKVITDGVMKQNGPMDSQEAFISGLRNLGGYSNVIRKELDRIVKQFDENPRVRLALPAAIRRIEDRIPEIRLRIQHLLARVPLELVVRRGDSPQRTGVETTSGLTNGTYTEVVLRHKDISWIGIADMIHLSVERCTIRDFKSGKPDPAHRLQLRIYAWLWARDRTANPLGRLADELVITYAESDIYEIPPTRQELDSMDKEFKYRTAIAIETLNQSPPPARPNAGNCRFCGVRQLCNEYWAVNSRDPQLRLPERGKYSDVELKITESMGPHSWLAQIMSSSVGGNGEVALLHLPHISMSLDCDECIRLIGANLNAARDEFDQRQSQHVTVTANINTEIYYK